MLRVGKVGMAFVCALTYSFDVQKILFTSRKEKKEKIHVLFLYLKIFYIESGGSGCDFSKVFTSFTEEKILFTLSKWRKKNTFYFYVQKLIIFFSLGVGEVGVALFCKCFL